MSPFEIVRDPRGSQVHVRRRDDGECVGCIEVGLYEVVRAAIADELRAQGQSTQTATAERTSVTAPMAASPSDISPVVMTE